MLLTYEDLKKEKSTDQRGQVVKKEFVGKIIKNSINEKDFTVDAIVTDESIDSARDSVLASAWNKKGRMKRYEQHPILLNSHDYRNLFSDIGEAVKLSISRKNKNMVVKFHYYVGEGNPFADWAWKLAQKGIAAFSVGFRVFDYIVNDLSEAEFKAGDKPWFVYTDVELYEISQVVVPSNMNALQKSLTPPDDTSSFSTIDTEFFKKLEYDEIMKAYSDFNTLIEKALPEKTTEDDDYYYCSDILSKRKEAEVEEESQEDPPVEDDSQEDPPKDVSEATETKSINDLFTEVKGIESILVEIKESVNLVLESFVDKEVEDEDKSVLASAVDELLIGINSLNKKLVPDNSQESDPEINDTENQ